MSYMDNRLKRNNRLYADFIRKCLTARLIKLTMPAKSAQGFFFVNRKDGRWLMIVDCRPSNRLSPPYRTHLNSGEGLGEFEIIDGEFFKSGLGLHFG